MRVALFFFLIIMVLFSCKKKFKHEDSSGMSSSTCTLCQYADSLNGNYRGKVTGYLNPNNPTADSLTVTLEHIYLNLGNAVDSNTMFFKMTKVFDSNLIPTVTTVSIDNSTGVFYESGGATYGEHRNLSVSDSTMIIYDWYENIQMASFGILLDFHGKKL